MFPASFVVDRIRINGGGNQTGSSCNSFSTTRLHLSFRRYPFQRNFDFICYKTKVTASSGPAVVNLKFWYRSMSSGVGNKSTQTADPENLWYFDCICYRTGATTTPGLVAAILIVPQYTLVIYHLMLRYNTEGKTSKQCHLKVFNV